MSIKLKCTGETFDGKGIVTYKEKEYQIANLLKDEEGIFALNSYGRLILEKIEQPSVRRKKSYCSAYNVCGGCQYLHISYEEELRIKQAYFNDLFKKFTNVEKQPIVGMFDSLGYRNKCQMVYKLSKTKKVTCGFYQENTHNIIPVNECLLHSSAANNLIKIFNEVLTRNKITPYDEKTKTGVVRHILVRYGFFTKQIMLVIVTNGEIFPGRNNVIKDLLKQDLNITTIIQNINSRDTSIVLGEKERILYGPGFITDRIGDYSFKISSKSFYQVNPLGMKKLYERAIELADISPNDYVLDTYCGVGTIGIFAAEKAKHVVGVEINKEAIKDAISNARTNKIKNIEFVEQDATFFMQMLAKNQQKVDVVFLDPPRTGSSKQFINALGHLKPRTVIYISCEPTTLKRDLYDFSEAGFVVEKLEAFDMFPRTFNIECVCTLSRKDVI